MTTATARPPHRAADLEVAHAILEVLPRLGRLVSQSVRQSGGLSLERTKLLLFLQRGPLRSGEVAHHLFCSPSTMTEIVEALVSDGLVARVDDPRDRRAVVLTLTSAGRRELRAAESAASAALAQLAARLDAAERERVRRAFADLGRALEE